MKFKTANELRTFVNCDLEDFKILRLLNKELTKSEIKYLFKEVVEKTVNDNFKRMNYSY